MLWSERRGDEVFVFWRGELIYKRWVSRGHGVLFEGGRPPRWGV